MTQIKAEFMVIKVEDNVWDVAIFGEPGVLEAFSSVYHAHYVHESVFDKKPMALMADFPNKNHAEIWKQYWVDALNSPEDACKSCATVNELFQVIYDVRQGK